MKSGIPYRRLTTVRRIHLVTIRCILTHIVHIDGNWRWPRCRKRRSLLWGYFEVVRRLYCVDIIGMP